MTKGQPGYDGRPLAQWLKDNQVPNEIIHRDTYSVVMEVTKPGGTYCAPCSRMRRGILYDAAERLGCNRIALGHHRDDALETLLMNLFFQGRLQANAGKIHDERWTLEVIRPLIEVAEAQIEKFCSEKGFQYCPVIFVAVSLDYKESK